MLASNMRPIAGEGPLFSQPHNPLSSEGVATGEISPYESAESWGNGSNPDALKELGQVATPPEIAQIMARWIAANNPSSILDPAAGLGNLLFESHKLCPSANLFGIEQDSITHKKAMLGAPSGTRLILADYLKYKIEKVDAIIANPPYVKAHHLIYKDEEWASFEAAFGIGLDRLTNLYALFLLKIWEDLTPNGRAAIIIPAEFLNANFGVSIKNRLLKAIRPSGIAVFDPSFSVFRNALTTSCILFILKGQDKPAPIIACKVKSIEETKDFAELLLSNSLGARVGGECHDISSWNPADKWLNKILGAQTEGLDKLSRKIGDYFRCRRGIATGGNDYFTLSRMEIESKKLRMSDFSPCIVHAAHAKGLIFTAKDFDELARSGKKCFLLDPKGKEDNLERYLEEGVKAGIPERHLPSHRPVWYLPENREPADIWVGVFSRESLKCAMNDAKVKNLTCFHGMYIRTPQEGLVELMTLFLNSSYGRTAFGQVNRFYGNGLNKLEPKDVEAMPCPNLAGFDRAEANRLHQMMIEFSQDPLPEQQCRIDKLLGKLLGLSC